MDQAFCGGHEDSITAHERVDSATVSYLRVGEAHDQGAHGGPVSAARRVHDGERALPLAKRWRDLRELPGLAALRRNELPSTRTLVIPLSAAAVAKCRTATHRPCTTFPPN